MGRDNRWIGAKWLARPLPGAGEPPHRPLLLHGRWRVHDARDLPELRRQSALQIYDSYPCLCAELERPGGQRLPLLRVEPGAAQRPWRRTGQPLLRWAPAPGRPAPGARHIYMNYTSGKAVRLMTNVKSLRVHERPTPAPVPPGPGRSQFRSALCRAGPVDDRVLYAVYVTTGGPGIDWKPAGASYVP